MTLDHSYSLDDVDARLARVQEDRKAQLLAAPPIAGDPAVAAYRANLEAHLRDVRIARDRITAGEYGLCMRCTGAIADERLELRPWALTCAPCASRA